MITKLHSGMTLEEIDAVIASFERNDVVAKMELDESQRQTVLLALAKLSVERPGWDEMLKEIANKIDVAAGESLSMYAEFKRIRMDIPEPHIPLIQIVRAVKKIEQFNAENHARAEYA